MSSAIPIVFIVDDDVSVREWLEVLIRSEGWQPETFEFAQQFLARPRALVPSCLVLDFGRLWAAGSTGRGATFHLNLPAASPSLR
jgi:FixJ family two-component response regulator